MKDNVNDFNEKFPSRFAVNNQIGASPTKNKFTIGPNIIKVKEKINI